jgi:hypothetical protein
MNNAIGSPVGFANGRLSPGVQVGLSKAVNKKSKSKALQVQVNAGYMKQKSLQSSVYVAPALAYHIKVTQKLSVAPSMGVRLMATQQANKEFIFDASTSTFKPAPSMRFQVQPTIGLAPTYNVYADKRYQYALFASYNFGAQLPFSALSNVLPMNIVEFGLRITPLK